MTAQVSRAGRWLLPAMLVLVAATTPAAAIGDGSVLGSSHLDAGGESGVGPASVATTTHLDAVASDGPTGDPGADLVPPDPDRCSAGDPAEWRACAGDTPRTSVDGRTKPRLVRAADLTTAVPGVGDYDGLGQVRTMDPGPEMDIVDADGDSLADLQRPTAPVTPSSGAEDAGFVAGVLESLGSTTDSPVPVTLPGVAIGAILGAVVVLSALYPGRRFTDSVGELVPGVSGTVQGDGTFSTATAVPATGETTDGSADDAAPTPRGGRTRCDGDGGDPPDADVRGDDLVPDETVVERLLESHGGRMKQGAIVDDTTWSKSKVSRLLSRMTEDGTIVKVKLGRENLICLDGSEPEIVSDPVPNRKRTAPGSPLAGSSE